MMNGMLIKLAAKQAQTDFYNNVKNNPYKRGLSMYVAYEKVYDALIEKNTSTPKFNKVKVTQE